MEIMLPLNETIGINGDTRGMTIRCLDGIVWVTQEGDGNDYFLGAGKELAVRLAGKLVLEAHRGTCRFVLASQRPERSGLELHPGLCWGS